MVRFVVSGLVLIVIVMLIGRCQLGNVGVGMGLSVHDTLAVILSTKSQIERYHYDRQKLPEENRDLNLPPPHLFGGKSPLIRHFEVLKGGVIYIQLTAEHRGHPVELVYRPTVESRYRLNWTCESYNLTKEWRATLPDVCGEAPALFDRSQIEQAAATEDYLARVTREQRAALAQASETPAAPACVADALAPGFAQVDDSQITVWRLGVVPGRQFALARPQDMARTGFLALEDQLYFYAGDRVRRVLQGQVSQPPQVSAVHLFDTRRWRWSDGRLWMNSGPGLVTLNPCANGFHMDTQYLLDLGAFNRIVDFALQDGLALLSTEESTPGSQYSAIQIVRLPANRALGFLRLEGRAHGLARGGRYLYVANGAHGISLVDLLDLNAPRLVRRISTRDAAMDVLVRDKQLLVADRLGGLALYQRQDDNLTLVQRSGSHITAEQLHDLGDDYIGVTAKDGTTSLWRWRFGLLEAVELR